MLKLAGATVAKAPTDPLVVADSASGRRRTPASRVSMPFAKSRDEGPRGLENHFHVLIVQQPGSSKRARPKHTRTLLATMKGYKVDGLSLREIAARLN